MSGVIVFGALFLAIGLALAGGSVSFLSEAKRAPGTVVGMDWRSGSSGQHGVGRRTHSGPTAHPVVAFTAADGVRRTFTGSVGSKPPAYDEGERVEVLYRPGSPEDARIDSFVSLWLLPLVFGGIGLVITGVGTAVAVVMRRQRAGAGISAPAKTSVLKTTTGS
ncbi:DUF3592 domain-containing protein [Streptomyces sp. NPDC090108]|uniref:DUF3592 domain-containing protein n=1 Tax=Streptomyces sp. NPDC090108 TaxID=3365947 RepID=UPI00382F46FE